MNIKVNNTSSVKKSSKTSKSSASQAEGLGFASALSSAQHANSAEQAMPTSGVESISSFVLDTADQVPTQAKQRGYYILDILEELEQDILEGKETKVMPKLEKALAVESVDKESLPQVVRELMDEIDSRAAIELEKLKL